MWNAICHVFEKAVLLTGGFLARFGIVTEPLRHRLANNGFLLFFLCAGLLILGVVLVTATKSLRRKALEGLSEDLESARNIYSILTKLLYYPMVFETALLCTVSGRGRNTGIFQGMVDSETRCTFFNFPEWNDTAKYFLMTLLAYFFLRTLACVLRRKPLKLLRFWVHTSDFVILGLAVGHLYLAMVDARAGNFLLTLLFLPVELFFYMLYPITFAAYLSPLVLVVIPLLLPLGMLLGGLPFFLPVKYESELDPFAHFFMLNAWADFLSQ